LPLNSQGRLDRKRLPDPRIAAQRSLGLVQPRTPTEIAIAQIWAEILVRGGIGIHENFFDVGGTSLQVVLVVTKLRKAFSQELPVTALFAHPTIAAMAEYLERDQNAATSTVADGETRRQALQQQQELRLRIRSRGSEGTA
jgi:acyl carrier protein